MARTITAHMFSSVNGVSESPERFQFDAFGQAEGEMMGKTLAGVTDVVMGRTLWQEWSEFWPPMEGSDPFAAFINPVRKHVISTTLTGELGWDSTLVDGDPVDAVRQLRDQQGGDILVAGGIETVRSLFLAGLIDALTLTGHSAVTGEGRRLFDKSVPVTRLRLVEGATTPAGNAMLTYALRG
jgi:dihydrofolate reductase